MKTPILKNLSHIAIAWGACFYLFGLTSFSSCSQPNPSSTLKDKPNISDSIIQIGEVVQEMKTKPMVIFQDSQNNYGFGGGTEGVYKQDEKNLVLYTAKDGLPSHSIIGIQEDQYGNMYFDSPEGVSKFDGQKFTILEVIESAKNEWK